MKKGIKSSSLTVFAMIAATLISKALGMVRGMIIAWTLGDSLEAVAFTAASKIPCAVFDFLFSAAILGCFIPVYNEAKAKREKDAYRYSSVFMSVIMIICAALALLGIFFAPQIIKAVSPKISEEASALAARLLRIMFPMMVFTAGAYTLTGILQSAGRFILPAAVSSLSNIAMIAYLLLSGERFSVYALSLVYVISWFLQFLTLALPLIPSKLMPRPCFDFKNEYLIKSAKTAPHIMAGSWLSPVSVLIASFFSSFVSDSTFVAYDYASGIYVIIAGIAVYGVGNFVFPSLSRLAAENLKDSFAKSVKNSVFYIILMILPVFAATFALSYEGIALLYLRDNFTEELAKVCAVSLRTLSLSMPAYAISEILCRTFYAAGKAKIPMYASFSAISVSVVSNMLFMLIPDAGIFGISFSFTVSQYVYAAVLIFNGRRHFPDIFRISNRKKAFNLAAAGALCFAAMLIGEKKIPLFSGMASDPAYFLKIAIVFMIGIVIYLIYIFVSRTLSHKDVFGKRGENN